MILPLVPSAGGVAVREVAVGVPVIVPATPLKLTPVAPRRFVPVIVTGEPKVGVKLETVGAGSTTAKLTLGETPAGVVTVIVPLGAPVGTFTVRLVSVAVVAGVALTVVVAPTKFTFVAPKRLVPVIVIVAPTAALAGAVMPAAGK